MPLDMLRKEICVNCHEIENVGHNHHWDNEDDRDWNQGVIKCSFEYVFTDKKSGSGFYIDRERPPTKCPYRLEHLLATQKGPRPIYLPSDLQGLKPS